MTNPRQVKYDLDQVLKIEMGREQCSVLSDQWSVVRITLPKNGKSRKNKKDPQPAIRNLQPATRNRKNPQLATRNRDYPKQESCNPQLLFLIP